MLSFNSQWNSTFISKKPKQLFLYISIVCHGLCYSDPSRHRNVFRVTGILTSRPTDQMLRQLTASLTSLFLIYYSRADFLEF
jgi:hypothetical protein